MTRVDDMHQALDTTHDQHRSLTTDAPNLGAEEAENLAQTRFGIEGKVTALSSERDQNFLLRTADGRAFVLKISNPSEDPDVVDFHTRALIHVARADPSAPTSKLVPTVDGEPEMRLRLGGNRRAIVRVLTYLEGRPLQDVGRSRRQRKSLGASLARLDLALGGFDHPAARHDLLWDVAKADRLRPIAAALAEPAQARLTTYCLDVFETYVKPVSASLRAQVIHNDLSPSNVLVDAWDHDLVTGIIDFGDMVHAPLVNDVAVGATYHLAKGQAPLEHVGEFLAAYHAVLPLRPEEVDVVFDLITTRLAMIVTITAWRASRYPGNEAYILRNHRYAQEALEAFRTFDRVAGRDRLRSACGL